MNVEEEVIRERLHGALDESDIRLAVLITRSGGDGSACGR
jgi:hypothetical protein